MPAPAASLPCAQHGLALGCRTGALCGSILPAPPLICAPVRCGQCHLRRAETDRSQAQVTAWHGGAARLNSRSHQRCSIPLLVRPLRLLVFTMPSAQEPGVGRDQESGIQPPWLPMLPTKTCSSRGLHIPVCCCRIASCYFPALSPGGWSAWNAAGVQSIGVRLPAVGRQAGNSCQPLWCQSWASVHGKEHLSSTMLRFCGQGWILTLLPTLPQPALLLLQAGLGCSQVRSDGPFPEEQKAYPLG